MKKIIIGFILIVLVVFFLVFFVVSSNNKYIHSLEKEIRNNYEIDNEINYLNKYGLYYIIVTDNNLIVLNNGYQEIFKDDADKIKKIDKDAEIVYRLNMVMYEVLRVSKDKIVYEYYDLYTNELIDTLEIGG